MKVSEALKFANSKAFFKVLRSIYGVRAKVQKKRYLTLLERAGNLFGFSADVLVARAPGRVNLMGRHVDYMGGYVNPVATTFDVISVLERRRDDWVYLYNMNPRYEAGYFRISEEMPDVEIRNLSDWDKWTVRIGEEKMRRGGYKWFDYIKGLFIYIQAIFKNKIVIDGFNILVDGNIPPKKGISSSSALVVSVAIALNSLYDFNVPLSRFIDIVGYSEWYRLTRGGTADHAAIILSKKGYVSHISCLPTKVEEVKYAALPAGYSIYLIDSGIERPHTEDASNLLRSTAAAYRIGVLLLKSLFPQYADKIKLLRDFNVKNLGVSLAELYAMLKKIPEKISREKLRKIIDERYLEELEVIFSNHEEPRGGYRLRENIVYGLSETERAKMFPIFLENKNIGKILKLIETSHNGDRICRFDESLKKKPWDSSLSSSDSMLDKYIEILKARPSEAEKVQLHWIPGGYGRSIEEIDFICDYIRNHYRCYAAAQLMGAGLGGSVIALVREDKIKELRSDLTQAYLDYYGLRPAFTRVESSEGAKLLFK